MSGVIVGDDDIVLREEIQTQHYKLLQAKKEITTIIV